MAPITPVTRIQHLLAACLAKGTTPAQILWKPWLTRAEMLISQKQARTGLLPFQGLFTLEKANVGSDPIQDLSRIPWAQTSCSPMSAPIAITSLWTYPTRESSSSTPSPNTIPHHASEGWVKGSQGPANAQAGM